MPVRARFGQSCEVTSIPDSLEADPDATRHGRFGHDFSRISVHGQASAKIQPKLTANNSGDIYEEDADRISKYVMRMPESRLQRACSCGGGCSACQTEQPEQEPERLQAKRVQASDMGQIEVPSIVHEVLASPGQPLDATTRGFMEPRFGHDFAHVRVHADAKAAESARAVNALAYTAGHDVVFGAGQYKPNTSAGRQLVAHELSHTIQQRAAIPWQAEPVRGDSAAPSKSTTVPMIQRAMKFELQTKNVIRRTGGKKPQNSPASLVPETNAFSTKVRKANLQKVAKKERR
jgi:hypothetical protein